MTLGGRLASIRLPLLTPRLALRLPEPIDVPFLVRWVNDAPVFRPLVGRPRPYTRREEVAWVRNSQRAASRGEKLNLAITRRESGDIMGGVGLEIRDWDNGRGRLGYWLAPDFWHAAYGSEAASAVCAVAFRRLKLHRIDAAVYEFNPRSMSLLRRLGFRREGNQREVLFRGRTWHDEVTFGLLSSEFRPFRPG